jgi:hypothetical protein
VPAQGPALFACRLFCKVIYNMKATGSSAPFSTSLVAACNKVRVYTATENRSSRLFLTESFKVQDSTSQPAGSTRRNESPKLKRISRSHLGKNRLPKAYTCQQTEHSYRGRPPLVKVTFVREIRSAQL